jgi:hypothetical protein
MHVMKEVPVPNWFAIVASGNFRVKRLHVAV